MFATALPRVDWTRLRLTRSERLRAVAIGSTWGVALTTGLAAMTFWKCGLICLPEIAENAVLSVAGGIVTVGAAAAYGRR